MKHYLHVEAYENPIEKALEYKRIMQKENLNQNQLAKKLGISRVRVNQILKILKLPQGQQDYVMQYGKIETITERSLRNSIKCELLHELPRLPIY